MDGEVGGSPLYVDIDGDGISPLHGSVALQHLAEQPAPVSMSALGSGRWPG